MLTYADVRRLCRRMPTKRRYFFSFKKKQILLREMPLLLSELRDEDIALGSLRSLPLSPAQVWKTAS